MNSQKENLGAAPTASEALKINTLPEHVENDSKPSIKNKQCKACGNRKPVSEFRKNAKTTDGRLNTCKSCLAANKRPSQSLRQAINAKCAECIYDPLAGGGSRLQQITSCTSPNCPLFDVRPTSKGLHDG